MGLRGVLVVATAGATLVVLAPNAAGAPAPTAGWRAGYGFSSLAGGTVRDASPSGLTGRIEGTALPVLGNGPSGHGAAIVLDSARRQLVRVPDAPALDVDRFTLAAWVRYAPNVHDQRWEVLEKADAYWLNIRTDTRRLRAGGFFGSCVGRAGSSWRYVDSTVTIAANTWTHVAATYDGARLRVYLNGTLRGSIAVTGRTCSNAEDLVIGAKHISTGTPEAFFDGRIDDVRIYDRALSQSQVRDVRQAAIS